MAFLPLHALVTLVEVSMGGGDPLAQKFWYDLSAWSVLYGLPLAVRGLTAVPLLIFSTQLARNWVTGKRLTLVVGALTPVLFLVNFILVSAIFGLGSRIPWLQVDWMWIRNVPVAFALSSFVYGLMIGGLLSEPSDRAGEPSSRWGLKVGALYAVPAALMSVYALLLPNLAPRLAYRYSGMEVRISIAMDVLDTLREGTPVADLERQLPGFLPDDYTGDGKFSRYAGNDSYGYEITIDSGRVTELELRGGE